MNVRRSLLAVCVPAIALVASFGCASRPREPEAAPSQSQAGGWELRRNLLATDERQGSEPKYIWVKKDQPLYKDPPTLNRLIFGPEADLAPPDVQERLASTRPKGDPPSGTTTTAQASKPAPAAQTASITAPAGTLGYVVDVRGKRLFTDLTAKDGIRIGSTLVILREGDELKHPVTGKVLGRTDEDIATARVMELRPGFSIAEIVDVKPGQQIRIKDRVIESSASR